MQCERAMINTRTGLSVFGLICFIIVGCSSEVNYTPPEGSTDLAITHYSFGKITIDGKTYENDIAINPDGIVNNWRAQVNHAIQLVDLKKMMDGPIKTFIIGIGANKGCSIADEIKTYAQSKNIKLHILDTFGAVELFNAYNKQGLAACFHINC